MQREFEFAGVRLFVDETPYYGNPTQKALVLHPVGGFSARDPFGVLTVNIPGVTLDEGEYLIKTWSENEHIAAAALASGLFEDTGRRVVCGETEAEVWRWAR